MVWVGESVALPDSCELLTTVRVVPPAFAVMVTEFAFAACQLSVTDWPLAIDVELAEKVNVGDPLPPPPTS